MLTRLLWRLPLLLVAALAAAGPARALAGSALAALGPSGRAARLVWAAIVVGAVAASLVRRRLEWLAVFAHEQAHALAALSLLRPVTGFRATARSGGLVTFRGPPSLWIAGAPYALPLASLAAAIVALATTGLARPTTPLSATMGFAIGVHLALAAEQVVRNAGNVHAGGSANDFTPFGRPATLLHVLVLNVVLLATLVAFASGGGAAVASLWREAMRHDAALVRGLVAR